MTAEYRGRLASYRTTMSLASEMLSGGIITTRDYNKIDRIIARKYGLSLCGICCRDPLINHPSRANIAPADQGDEGFGKDD